MVIFNSYVKLPEGNLRLLFVSIPWVFVGYPLLKKNMAMEHPPVADVFPI